MLQEMEWGHVTHPQWCAVQRSQGRWCRRWQSRYSLWNLKERNRADSKLEGPGLQQQWVSVELLQPSEGPAHSFTSVCGAFRGNAALWLAFRVSPVNCSSREHDWPAGMIPMRSEQGSRVSSGQFRSIPLSICVLQIRPWMISLNIPSPPTHTTLHESQPSMMSPDQCGLDCNISSV